MPMVRVSNGGTIPNIVDFVTDAGTSGTTFSNLKKDDIVIIMGSSSGTGSTTPPPLSSYFCSNGTNLAYTPKQDSGYGSSIAMYQINQDGSCTAGVRGNFNWVAILRF